jgi:hypothetical protein
MTESKDISYQEQGIVTIYLPTMKAVDMFEIYQAIKTAVGSLDKVKIDFRVLTQKGIDETYGGLGNKSGDPNEHSRPL